MGKGKKSGASYPLKHYAIEFKVFQNWNWTSSGLKKKGRRKWYAPAKEGAIHPGELFGKGGDIGGFVYVFKKISSRKKPGYYIRWHAELWVTQGNHYLFDQKKFRRGVHHRGRLPQAKPKGHYDLEIGKDDQEVVFFYSQDQLPYWRLQQYFNHGKRRDAATTQAIWKRLKRRGLVFRPGEEKFIEEFVNFRVPSGGGMTWVVHLVDFRQLGDHFQGTARRNLDALSKFLGDKRKAKVRYLASMTKQIIDSLGDKKANKYLDAQKVKDLLKSYDYKTRKHRRRAEKANRYKVLLLEGKFPYLRYSKYVGNGFQDVRRDYVDFRSDKAKHPDLGDEEELKIAKQLEDTWAAYESRLLEETSQSPKAFKLLVKSFKRKKGWYTLLFDTDKAFSSGRKTFGNVKKVIGLWKELSFARLAKAATGSYSKEIAKALKSATKNRFGLQVSFDPPQGRLFNTYQMGTKQVVGAPLTFQGKRLEVLLPFKDTADAHALLKTWSDGDLGAIELELGELEKLAERYDRAAKVSSQMAQVAILLNFINLFTSLDTALNDMEDKSIEEITVAWLGVGGAAFGTYASLGALVQKFEWNPAGTFAKSTKVVGVLGAVIGYGLSVRSIAKASYDGDVGLVIAHTVSAAGAVFGIAGLAYLSPLAATGWGLAIALAGMFLVWLFTEPEDPPLVKWMKVCHWGHKKDGSGGSIDRQIQNLIKIAFGPRVKVWTKKWEFTLILIPGFYEHGETGFEITYVRVQIHPEGAMGQPLFKREVKGNFSAPGSAGITHDKKRKRFLLTLPFTDWDGKGNHMCTYKVKVRARYKKGWSWKDYTLEGSFKVGDPQWDGDL